MRGRCFVAAGVLLLAGACSTAGADQTGSTPQPQATTSSTTPKKPVTVVKVTMKNFEYVGIPGSVKGRAIRFDAANNGPSDHELEIIGPDGEPVGEIEAMPPGKKGSLTLDLAPGKYTAQCLVPEGTKTHKDLGMVQEFEVK